MKALLYFVFNIVTAMVGYTIHGDVFWALIDFLFAPIAWAKWLIFHEITLSVLKVTFGWFFV